MGAWIPKGPSQRGCACIGQAPHSKTPPPRGLLKVVKRQPGSNHDDRGLPSKFGRPRGTPPCSLRRSRRCVCVLGGTGYACILHPRPRNRAERGSWDLFGVKGGSSLFFTGAAIVGKKTCFLVPKEFLLVWSSDSPSPPCWWVGWSAPLGLPVQNCAELPASPVLLAMIKGMGLKPFSCQTSRWSG